MKSASLDLDTEDLAQLYEQVSADRQYKAGQRLIQDLAVAEGETVLDIGCGTGLLAEYIAAIIGPGGSVIGIDPLPLRVEIAKHRTHSNLDFRTGNAYDLSEFPLGTFDVVCMNAVFHWLPEKREPLRQIVRVLKKGGRLGISTGSKADPSPLHLIKEQVLSRAPYNRYPAAAESVAHRVSVEELASLLTEAGFEVKAIEARPIARREMTAEATIRFSEASSFGNFLGHLPEELSAPARDEIRRELEQSGVLATMSRARLHIVAVAAKP
jgi:ubiquinone/menaquinone biosynthesis C-methylase UbiE